MSNKSTPATTELRHYIRANKNAAKREIIVEEVRVGSSSFDFLKKMENRRKKHECVRTVDMRGKVPYECKSYVHKNQVFWMDDISYGIFLRGLKKNNDVFTNEIFEEIVNGDHTNHKSSNAVSAKASQSTPKIDSSAPQGNVSGPVFNEEKFRIEGEEANIFYLGYYQKRVNSRLKHTTDITIKSDDTTVLAKTKDISAGGFKATLQKPVNLDKGDQIRVTFNGFNNSAQTSLNDISYQVISLEYHEPDFILRTCLSDDDNTTADYISGFIKEQQQNIKGRRKIDIEDIRLTAESQLTELFYTNTTPTIPFFIRSTGKKLQLQTICVNVINKPMIQCFRNANDCFDFTNFSEQSRIERLVEIVQDDGQRDPMLAVYMDASGSPKVMFDYEFESYDIWLAFVLDKLNKKNLNLFKVIIRTVTKPDQRKLDQKIDKLRSKSESSVADMQDFANQIVEAGVLVDLTTELSQSMKTVKLSMEHLKKATELCGRFENMTGNDVEIIQFGYTEQRREDRYHVSVDAEVQLDKQLCKAVTKDISLKGLCVELNTSNMSGFKKGDEVKVDFPVLHQRAKERIKLVDMPYTITCIHYENGKPILHFKREKTKYWNEQTGFFKDMIDRNIKLIKLDTKDIETATKSKLIGSIAVENTATLPMFILKNAEGGGKSANIALPPQSGDLTDFFEVEPGVFDFKPLTHPNRLSKLTNNIRNGSVSDLIVYMYKKQVPGIAKFNIYSAIDSDFENDQERRAFMGTCLEHDYCIIKVSVSQSQKPVDTEIVSAVEKLQDTAPHGVQRLVNQFNSIIAIGDITDISNQIDINH
jgi:hypothetical protein